MEVLAASPLLTLFVVVALGTAVGAVPVGPVRFGAAGALFVGLALGALDPRLGEGLVLVQTLGLALFVYTVGLAAGSTFFRDLRRQLPLMGVGVAVLLVAATTAAVVGRLLGVDGPLAAGAFTGALTSTPALAAATAAAGDDVPAVGYSLAYPIGVVVAILVVGATVSRRWPARRDPQPAAGVGLEAATAEVDRVVRLGDVPGFAEQAVRMSYLSREGRTRVVTPDEQLQPGDRVVVVGPREEVALAVGHLGRRLTEHLADDRTSVENQRFVVSDRRVAGRTVAELDMAGRFDGVVTRVRRGDLDLLARDDLTLELGDRVLAVVPRDRLEGVSEFFGDSERRVSEIDAITVGVGLGLGLLIGLVTVPLPGGVVFALGSAAGPLIVGMVLGRLERSGPLVWGMPLAANLTIRQLGLLLFLAAVGLSSGQAFAAQAFTGTGLRVAVLALAVVGVSSVLFVVGARAAGASAPRAAGALAGFVGQPAILAHAASRVVDERVEAGYAALFALGIIVKILLVQVLVVL
ncbi:aspartate:alanine exchanger family transporter [Actinotalea sp. K2]|uniref:aspartate:alanine exchanger family transporter n=1 Tax=Actinotalea sp. K2 TaxID=2939438 RepID=UPI002017A827|nr:TrkA C-terminal domain-containing protein [Actinotalea sp. K2]MCL3860832.1 transporter [Actinotalea sp. K2]